MVAWPASRPALVGGQVRGPGGRAGGLPTMYGFPTMYLASPPCILIKGIRYQESGIRYKVLGSILYALPALRIAALRIAALRIARFMYKTRGWRGFEQSR